MALTKFVILRRPQSGRLEGRTPASPNLRRAAPVFGELLELRGFEVGDGPESHAVLRPVHDVIALALGTLRRRLAGGGPDEQVDDVLVALIDQGRDRPAVEVVEPGAGQRKARGREVFDRRGEIDAAVKPRLDRVA